MDWSESEIQALFQEVYSEVGTTWGIHTTDRLNLLLAELAVCAWEWDYNAMCERNAVRTAQRLAQGGMSDEE